MLIALGCAGVAGAAAPAGLDAQVSQLDAIRRQCVTAAQSVQKKETSIGALDLAVNVMLRGAETKRQQITESRDQQEALLGALERLARAPPAALAFAPEGPIELHRGALLMAAAVPALFAEAHRLGGQLAALASAQNQIDARRKEIDEARAALAKARDQLAQLVARRNALTAQLLHDDGGTAPDDRLGEQASDLFDLIRRADAATEKRDKDLAVRLRVLYGVPARGAAPTDPTRPKDLRALDAPSARMVWPVSGELVHRFGEADRYGRPSQGLTLQAVAGGLVVAPFDGRVDYVGPYGSYGLILIIRHAGGYHSLLAGLGRVDVKTGQWLLAGEPVGSLAGPDEKSAGATFYVELRREGRPVDPQSRLGARDQQAEDTRVRE